MLEQVKKSPEKLRVVHSARQEATQRQATDEKELKKSESDLVNPEEIKNVRVLTSRLQQLKKEWEEAEPQVYVDDTLLFTESWKETEGLPVDIRWAKALEKRLLECPILIRDGEIVVIHDFADGGRFVERLTG